MTGLYVRQLLLGPMQNFVYLLGARGAREVAVVDPAWDVPAILEAAHEDGKDIACVLLSHHHHDHVNGVLPLLAERPGVPVLAQRVELEETRLPELGFPVSPVEPGQAVQVGPLAVRCLHTPGHTPGAQCFHAGGALVSGDTLFIGGCGRCDFAGGDPRRMYHSLHRVLGALPDETVLYPGHDYADRPTSTLGEERSTNPYLLRRDEEEFVAFRMRPRN